MLCSYEDFRLGGESVSDTVTHWMPLMVTIITTTKMGNLFPLVMIVRIIRTIWMMIGIGRR